jgi:anti-sigma factor RsiW
VISRLSLATLLVLLSACGTTRVVRLDTGEGAPLEYRPLTWNKSVEVDAYQFEEALARLVLEEPLTLRSPQAGWLVRTSSSSATAGPQWHRMVGKSFGGVCKAGQSKEGCLSLLDDVMGLRERDKLAVALGLSFDTMRESIARVVEDTLAPQLFFGLIGTGLVTWVVLAANPEPVFTKAAAIVSAVMLVYLGVDAFLELVKASFELKRATDRATTFEELEEASHRFGRVVGPTVARVFILAVTVVVSQGMVGGSAWLASRLSMLPHFPEAAAVGVSQVGIRLGAVGQVSAVAVVEGQLVISLAPTAVAMMGGPPTANPSSGFRSWGSFNGLKSALGSAGNGKHWHHIVEQTESNIQRFGPHAIHNTENVIPLEEALHTRLSAFYSRKNLSVTGSTDLTVRQWLSMQSYEAQRKFGLLAIERVRMGVW